MDGKMSDDGAATRARMENVYKAFQETSAVASSALLFTLQWKHLEEHLDGRFEQLEEMESSLEKRRKEIEVKEKDLESMQTSVEDSAMKILEKEETLISIEGRVKECEEAVELKKKQLQLLEGLLTDSSKEVDSTTQRLRSVQNSLNSCNGKLDSKKDELRSVEGSLLERSRDIAAKEERLGSLNKKLHERSASVEETKLEMASKKKELDECEERITRRKELVESLERLIEEHNEQLAANEKKRSDMEKEIELKVSKASSLKRSVVELEGKIEEASRKLDQITAKTADLELKEKEIASLGASVQERTQVLSQKERKLEEQVKEFQLKQKNLNSKTEDVESREKEAASLRASVDERTEILAQKERKFEKQLKEFQLKQNNLNLPRNLQVKIEKVDCSSRNDSPLSLLKSPVSGIPQDPEKLRLLLCDYLELHDSVRDKVVKAVQISNNPEKLVLQAICSSNRESRYSPDIITRSSMLLLGDLSRVSPKITPEVKRDAVRVANQWKVKLNPDHTTDVLAFLQLVAVYELHSHFDECDVQNLLNSIPDEYPQVDALRKVLGSSRGQQDSLRSFEKCQVKIECDPSELAVTANVSTSLKINKGGTSSCGGMSQQQRKRSFYDL